MSEELDPNEFIITRKRKKYRFAKFHNAPNCFEFDQWTPRPVDVVEVGAGTALFLVELAAHHPEQSFLALDVKADRLQKGAYMAIERGLSNIVFVRARADQINEVCPPHSIKELWLTFSDPFPKQRSAGRRLSHPTFLAKYAQALAPSGSLNLKHDDLGFFMWSLEQLVQKGWRIVDLWCDLHQASGNEDAKTLTSYEKKWLADGRTTQYLQAIPSQKSVDIK